MKKLNYHGDEGIEKLVEWETESERKSKQSWNQSATMTVFSALVPLLAVLVVELAIWRALGKLRG